jgi:hypothetical protein
MTFERKPGTRLPDDPAYWERLAERAIDAAFNAPARRTASSVEPWWRTLSDASFVLAASAVLALIGGSLLLDERAPTAPTESHALAAALAPDDPLLASLLDASAGPPPATTLLRLIGLREERR